MSKLKNFYEEIENTLSKYDDTVDDIKNIYLTDKYNKENKQFDVEKFLEVSKAINYNAGYGLEVIDLDLVIESKNVVLTREEYDGSEWFNEKMLNIDICYEADIDDIYSLYHDPNVETNGKINFYEEIKFLLSEHGDTIDDIKEIYYLDIDNDVIKNIFNKEEFLNKAKTINYDNGYGSEVINTNIIINSKNVELVRNEYDGSEWFVANSKEKFKNLDYTNLSQNEIIKELITPYQLEKNDKYTLDIQMPKKEKVR